MRILFLTQILPFPLDSGAKVRAYYTLRWLAPRHAVTLVSFTRPTDSPAALAHLRTFCFCQEIITLPLSRNPLAEVISLAGSLLSRQPYTILRDQRRAMHRQLQALVQRERFDAIYADQLAMAPYALHAAQSAPRPPLLVLDAHNAYYLIPQRLAPAAPHLPLRLFLQREARLIARYEAGAYPRFHHLLTVAPADRAAIETLLPPTPPPHIHTMPICVAADAPPLARHPAPNALLLLGGLHWPPNADGARWFLRHVWPLIRQQAPAARLFIVGARPPADIQAAATDPIPTHPDQAPPASVTVAGYAHDLRPFLEAAAALIVPLRSGGGMRVKIIEAMQWGLPIVSTTIGCEGIEALPDHDILIADDPPALAQAALRLLQDPTLGRQLAANARRLLAARYDWQRTYTLLDTILPPAPPDIPHQPLVP